MAQWTHACRRSVREELLRMSGRKRSCICTCTWPQKGLSFDSRFCFSKMFSRFYICVGSGRVKSIIQYMNANFSLEIHLCVESVNLVSEISGLRKSYKLTLTTKNAYCVSLHFKYNQFRFNNILTHAFFILRTFFFKTDIDGKTLNLNLKFTL